MRVRGDQPVTPGEAAARLHRIADALERELPAALAQTRDDLLAEADWLSSGGISLRQMRRKHFDHPYAKRHGAPRRDPAVINVQTGAFRRGWQGAPVQETGGELVSAIYNTDPKAPYLEQLDGGPRSPMFQRPIRQRLLTRTVRWFPRRIASAVRRALAE